MPATTPPPPGPARPEEPNGALDSALLRRLWRRVERPGLCRPGLARAVLERHRRMAGGLPLAELLQRRAELLTDEQAAWAPIVYPRLVAWSAGAPPGPAAPAAAQAGPVTRAGAVAGVGPPPGAAESPIAGAGRPAVAPSNGAPAEARSLPVVRATPAPAGPVTAIRASEAPAVVAARRLGGPEPAGAPPGSGPSASGPLTPSGASEALAVVAPARPASPGTGPGSQPLSAVRPAAPAGGPEDRLPVSPSTPRPAPERASSPPGPRPLGGGSPGGAPRRGLSTPDAETRARPAGGQGGATLPLPLVRPAAVPGPGGAAPAPWPSVAATGRDSGPALPVVGERVVRAAPPALTWTPAAVPAAPESGMPGRPAPVAPASGAPTPHRPAMNGNGVAAPSGPGAAGPAGRAGRARRQPALAPVEVDRIVNKVQRKLLHRMAIEAERRGTPR
jgi:hypothetical protein